jgi:phosphoribosylanthranilate isomerase
MCLIKFCGFTNLDDSIAAVQAGADMLGFNFHPPSPRSISPSGCAEIIRQLQPEIFACGRTITLVGVFVNQPAENILSVLEQCHLDLAQLSGDEPSSTLEAMAGRGFKAFRLSADAPDLIAYSPRSNPPAFLIDGGKAGQYGGTGTTADWSAAARLAEKHSLLLAGGLTPLNIQEAIRAVRPWGVDTASGIESTPGKKDVRMMRDFCRLVRQLE